MASPTKPCKDCLAEYARHTPEFRAANRFNVRPLVIGSGGRCATHWRQEKQRRKTHKHSQHVQNTYGLEDGEYEDLYLWQGGRCAICQRATGKTRRLTVDHDHKTGKVRGLLCRPCNTLLGRTGDSPAFFERGALYLTLTPYERFRNGG